MDLAAILMIENGKTQQEYLAPWLQEMTIYGNPATFLAILNHILQILKVTNIGTMI